MKPVVVRAGDIVGASIAGQVQAQKLVNEIACGAPLPSGDELHRLLFETSRPRSVEEHAAFCRAACRVLQKNLERLLLAERHGAP